jgi:RNA polymerase primary sigma factor
MSTLRNTANWINQKEIRAHATQLKKYRPLTREEENVLLERINNGDERAKEDLILANMRFVITVAKRYQNQGLSLNDLISEGNYGLTKAANRYDYKNKPVRFLSYAVWWIRQSITESLHLNSRTIRLPANVIGDAYRSSNEPLQDTAHDYTLTLPRMMSFDVSVDDDGNTLHELIADDYTKSPVHEMDNPTANIKSSLRKILSFLKANEQFVITKSFGLDGESWTLHDIAERMDLTKERVRQIKEKALKKLRSNSCYLIELVD